MSTLAATSWPDAAIVITAIAATAGVLCVLVWQLFATGRAGMTSYRDRTPGAIERGDGR